MSDRSTRDRLLDAYERLLVEGGTPAATLDAVAAAAEVSKGGLLYHFGSKDELRGGMLDRLRETAREDAERMRVAPEGPVEYYLQTSVDSGSDFDRALIAAACLAFESDEHATETMAETRVGWFEVLNDHLQDEALARTVQLIGDGLYFDDTTGLARASSVDDVRDVLRRLDVL